MSPSARPFRFSDGSYQLTLPAPEGPRLAALFPYAPGEKPDASNLPVTRICGRVMALIHAQTADFTCAHPRFHLDLAHLIDHPLAVMLRYLAHRPAEADFLRRARRMPSARA